MDLIWWSQYIRRCRFFNDVQTGVPRIVEIGSDLLENLWNGLMSVASVGFFVHGAGSDNFPALCRQDTRVILYWGILWGNRSGGALSFHCCILQEGKLPIQKHPSDQNSLSALLPTPLPPPGPWIGEPAAGSFLSGSWALSTSPAARASISLSKHPPTCKARVVFRLVPWIWKKTKKEPNLGEFHQSPPAITVQSLYFLCLSYREVLGENIFCDLFLELGSITGRLAPLERRVWNDTLPPEPWSVQRQRLQPTTQQLLSTWGFIKGESDWFVSFSSPQRLWTNVLY